MTSNIDTQLQSLFAESKVELEGESFVSGVMAGTRFLKYRLPFLLGGIGLVILVIALLLAPPLQGFAYLVAQGLMASLFDLGEGWAAWIFAPLNTLGSLLILVGKVIRMGYKKISGASYRF